MVPEKSLETGIGKNWYQKKVSEPLSEKIGTEISLGTGIGKFGIGKSLGACINN